MTLVPTVVRAIALADRDETDLVLDLVVQRRRMLSADGPPDRDRARVTRADMENWRHAVRLRSDVDAHVITRLVDHAWGTELVLDRLRQTLDRTYAHLEASDDGRYRRWCCRLPADDGTSTCDVNGRWIYVARPDGDRIVSRGLAGHLEAHRRSVPGERVRTHPLVGEYVAWDGPGELLDELEETVGPVDPTLLAEAEQLFVTTDPVTDEERGRSK